MNNENFIGYHEAKGLLRKYVLPVKTVLDYRISYKDIHNDLPSKPQEVYKGDWISWEEFLT